MVKENKKIILNKMYVKNQLNSYKDMGIKKGDNITELFYKNLSDDFMPDYLFHGFGKIKPNNITTQYYNEINKLLPKKILGKGTQGIVIEALDQNNSSNYNNVVVKIYSSPPSKQSFLLPIYKHLFHSDNSENNPPTIYESFYLKKRLNSLNRYINNNHLPQQFSVRTNEEIKKLKENGFNVRSRLYEVMAKYDYSLNSFIPILYSFNEQTTNNIIKSLFYQGLLTLIWLYMNKGISHNDISADNFLIKKTEDEYFEINIYNQSFKVKLYGYYLVLSDFGHASSIELSDYDKYPNVIKPSEQFYINPFHDIYYYIQMYKQFGVSLTILDNVEKPIYTLVIRNYKRDKYRHTFQQTLNDYKKHFFTYVYKKLLNENNEFI